MNKFELKELMDNEFKHINMDKEFYKKILSFVINWENKSSEYQEFVNSPLIGVHTIAFSTKDEGELFSDILRVDRDQLQQKIYKVDGINKNFLISSNVTNVTLVYLMHKTLTTSNDDEIIRNLYKIFSYKQIGSMYFNFFRFPLDRDKAVSTFEELSDRFLIKKLGSWEKVIIYQAELMVIENKKVSNKGNKSNREKIKDFETLEVVSAINDMNGRMKDMLCKLAEVLYSTIADKNSTLKSVNPVQDLGDGEMGIVSLTGGEYSYVQYLYSILDSRNDFVKSIGVDLVYQYVKKVDKSKLLRTLEYLTEIGLKRESEDDYVTRVMSESTEYLARQGIRGDYVSRLGLCLKKLNGYFRTATVKSVPLLEAKKILKEHTQDALGLNTKSTISSIVIGIMLYLFVRAVGKNSF